MNQVIDVEKPEIEHDLLGREETNHAVRVDRPAIERAVRDLLRALREDPDREGLRDTPRRVAEMWAAFIDYEPGSIATAFESVAADQLVVVSGMRIWSMCEHHLLPFWCDVSVGYIPGKQILGLSKFGRIAHAAAHGLQVQERLVGQIADTVQQLSASDDIAVIANGEHLCMTSRGVRTPHRMTSSVLRGQFRENVALRSEFLALALKDLHK